MNKKVTIQQKKFIEEYIKTLDGEASCKVAGYKANNLNDLSNKMLSDKKIINAIRHELLLRISALRVEKGYIVQKLLQIIEFSLEEEDILDKEGGLTGKRKLRDTSTGLKALENLCKHLGFCNSQDVVHQDAKIITISNLDENKL